jgi:hypothetical protein
VSRALSTVLPALAYAGQPYSIIQNNAGNGIVCIPLNIVWSNYGCGSAQPNVLINVNLQGITPGTSLVVIGSVRIDNTGCQVPVYVTFADTGFTVVAPPNTIVRENVFTNLLQAQIIAEGFTDGTAPGAMANICFFNAQFEDNVVDAEFNQAQALWLASASITKGSTFKNANFGTPALGDQATGAIVNVTAQVIAQQLLPALASGFYYITFFAINIMGLDVSGSATLTITIYTGSTILFVFRFFNNIRNYNPLIALPCQLKLDAKEAITIDFASGAGYPASGFAEIRAIYTTNPN